MKDTWRRICQATLALLFAGVVCVADNTSNNMPPPGTLNYVEGQVSVEGQKQSPKSVGATYLEPNQVMDTGNGNAEMLLTPGIYLRLGHQSEVKMIAPGLADTQVQVTHGSAMVEVDELFKENNVSVLMDNTTTQIEKTGLYEFDADQPSVKVLDGKAKIREGDQNLNLSKGHMALLAESQPLVRQKYNKDQVEEDPLYRWSKLRSEYSTEANVDEGNALLDAGGWWGPGWYWDPFWCDFAFMPGMGMFWGPFGYPFFSPWMVGWAPYYGVRGNPLGYYHYPVTGGAARANLPPLAHPATSGSAGFRPLSRGMGGSHIGMPAGGFHGMSASRGGFGMGGFHGGFGGRR